MRFHALDKFHPLEGAEEQQQYPEDICWLIRKICCFNIHKWVLNIRLETSAVTQKANSSLGTQRDSIFSFFFRKKKKVLSTSGNLVEKTRIFFPVGIQLTIATHLFFAPG